MPAADDATESESLRERAQASDDPVVDISHDRDGRTLYRGAVTSAGRIWGVAIAVGAGGQAERIDFLRAACDSDASQDVWFVLGHGQLPDFEDLAAWRALYAAFDVALRVYDRKFGPVESPDGMEVYLDE